MAVVTATEALFNRCDKALGRNNNAWLGYVPPSSRKDTTRRLGGIIADLLGTGDGNIDTDAVVIDYAFPLDGKTSVTVLDPVVDGLPASAASTLAMLLGAGLPVFVHCPRELPPDDAWAIGAAGARLLDLDQFAGTLRESLANLKYNRETLQVENEFAKVYDAQELAGAATVSAILQENEFVLKRIHEFARSATSKLRILDLGCGTGRFEELLLRDTSTRHAIEEIVAVDFAPMYLVEARKRLAHFLPKEDLNRVRLLRRIVEDLHFPQGHFDVVIASFGVVCFSRSHLTLQEVARVTKPRGLALFNGYNRRALTYEFDEIIGHDSPVTHFAIHIEREENKMTLGDRRIDCITFDVPDFENLLKVVGFRPEKDGSKTFPTLYGGARKDYLKKFALNGAPTTRSKHASGTCRGKGCASHYSYQEANLVANRASDFNSILHKMDEDLSNVLPDLGFYFSVAAERQAADA